VAISEKVYIHRDSLSIGITVLSPHPFQTIPMTISKISKRKMKEVAGYLEFDRVTEMRG
jgi:hypothetical protein